MRLGRARNRSNKLRPIELHGLTSRRLPDALLQPVTTLGDRERAEDDWHRHQFNATAAANNVTLGDNMPALLLQASVALARPTRSIDGGLAALRRQLEQLRIDIDLAVAQLRPSKLGAYSPRKAALIDFFAIRLQHGLFCRSCSLLLISFCIVAAITCLTNR